MLLPLKSLKCMRSQHGPLLIPLLCIFFTITFHLGQSLAAKQKRIPGTQRPYIINNRTYSPLPSSVGYEEVGIASWYGSDFHGNATSNGETYNMHGITAAHKLLPMHTMLLVENLDNGRKIVVRVNDRGPFVQGRIIDLSYGAAQKLALVHSGTAQVKVTALGETKRNSKTGQQYFRKRSDLQIGEYYVQIGAFTQRHNGLILQEKFSGTGHRTVMSRVLIRNQVFYRVQVYVGKTLNSARRSERALLKKGYKGAFIIAR